MASEDSSTELEELVRRLPATADVLALRAAAIAEGGEEQRAESLLRRAIKAHPKTSLRVTLARVLIRSNRHKEAMAEMVSVLRAEPENPSALVTLTTCLIECGELERGGKMLKKAAAAGAQPMEIQTLAKRWRDLVSQSTNPDIAKLTLDGIPSPGVAPELDARHDPRKRQRTLMGRPNPAFDVGDPRGRTAGKSNDSNRAPKRLPPPPLQSGSFASLDTYDLDGEPDDDLDPTLAGDRVRLAGDGSNRLVPGRGAPSLEKLSADNFAEPDEHTYALQIDDDELATPDEHTAHITLDEADDAALTANAEAEVRTVERSIDDFPSVEYDADFAAEARRHAEHPAPSDLDDLPKYESSLPKFDTPHIEADPTRPDFPPTKEERLHENVRSEIISGRNLPGLDPGVLFNDAPSPNRFPSGPQANEWAQSQPPQGSGSGVNVEHRQESGQQRRQHSGLQRQQSGPQRQQSGPHRQQSAQQRQQSGPQRHQSRPQQEQPHFQQPRPPNRPASDRFELEGNSVPVDQRWTGPQGQVRREETAVAAEPRKSGASASMRILRGKRWPIIAVIFLAVVVSGFLGLTFASGANLNKKLEDAVQAANDARAPDTYEGYLGAEKALLRGSNLASFMGSGFDQFVEKSIPIPGLSGAKLRKQAIADLAAVSGVLEHRFTSRGEHKASARTEAAMERAPDEPMTAVAQAYVHLTTSQPHEAVKVLDAAAQAHPKEYSIEQARAWALLEMDQVAEATRAVQLLRNEPSLSTHQKFLLASVDAARGDDSASSGFAQVFADSPDHVDARIARSYTLRGGEEAFKKAENVLDTVLVKLTRKASRYQKARATSAYGSLYLASGEKKSAEERFRSAIRKMPTRSELYLPLLEFYKSQGRRADLETLIAKANDEGAYSPSIAIFEARVSLLDSKPERTIEILEELQFHDVRKAYLHGLAMLDLHQPAKAVEVLDAGQKAAGDPLHVRALHFVARGQEKDEAVEDSVYQLERIKSKAADDSIVHWATALAEMRGAQVTNSKKKRAERLKSARLNLERAVELAPSMPRAHFALCEVHMRELNAGKAEAACLRGRALAPDFVPGMVTTARLRLLQGKFEEARELSDSATELRPNDHVVGLLNARVAIEERRLDDARKELNRWLAKPVDKYELSLLEGRLEFTQEHYTRAAGYLKEAFELDPDAGEAAVYYAQTLARLGELTQAAEILKQYLTHPTWAGYAWAILGEVRRKEGKVGDKFAMENFAKARKIYSDQTVPSRFWSHLYAEWALAYKARYRKWRHPRVYQMLERGREKGDANDPHLNMTFGLYYLEKRKPDYEAATKALEKVVEHAPYRCDAVETLRKLYDRAKRKDSLEKIEKVWTANCAPEDSNDKRDE